MSKKATVFSSVIFIVSLLLAISLLILSVLFLIIIKVIPPFIFLLIIDFGIFMIAYHYGKCWRYLKGEGTLDEKRKKRIHAVNTVIIFIALSMVIGMSSGLIYTFILFRAFVELQFYILLVDVFSALYMLGTALIDKRITC